MTLINDNGVSVAGLSLFSTIIVMVGTVLIELIRTRRRVDTTREVAEKVVENTAPISNGFARHLTEDVGEIKRMLFALADSQVELRKDLGTLSRRLDSHIEKSEGGK